MRGKVIWDVEYYECGGITPAYAGKSQCNTISAKNKKDHPRLCGEKVQIHIGIITVQGSPPPMRGKGKNAKELYFHDRITPAYAGKSRKISI